MGNLQSYLIFGGILASGSIFAYIAEKGTSKFVQKTNYALCFLVLLLPLAFRGESVGFDTITYYKWFKSASDYYTGEKFYLYWEPGFSYIIKALMKLNNSTVFVMFIFDFFILYFIVSRLWEYRNRIPFSEGIFLFITLFYLFCFNLTRQMLSLSLVFWATRYLEKNKYISFIIFVVLASTIHATAIVCSLILLVYMLGDRLHKRRKTLFFLISMGAIVILIIILGGDNTLFVVDRIQHYIKQYLTNGNIDLGFMCIIRFTASILIFCLIYRIPTIKNNQIKIYNFLYLIGTILAFVGSFFDFVERLGLFFLMYACVLFPMIFNSDYFNKRSRSLMKFGIYFACTLLYFDALIGNSQGQIPYTLVF